MSFVLSSPRLGEHSERKDGKDVRVEKQREGGEIMTLGQDSHYNHKTPAAVGCLHRIGAKGRPANCQAWMKSDLEEPFPPSYIIHY